MSKAKWLRRQKQLRRENGQQMTMGQAQVQTPEPTPLPLPPAPKIRAPLVCLQPTYSDDYSKKEFKEIPYVINMNYPVKIGYTSISCGVHELYLTSTMNRQDTSEEKKLETLISYVAPARHYSWYSGGTAAQVTGCKFVIFSDRVSNGYGVELAKYILSEKLGTITKSEEAVNPNSMHTIQVWIWCKDQEACDKWLGRRGLPLQSGEYADPELHQKFIRAYYGDEGIKVVDRSLLEQSKKER